MGADLFLIKCNHCALLDTLPERAVQVYGKRMVKQFTRFIKERNDRSSTTKDAS